ncbi:MAG: ABC transporter permease [Bacteroidales bacterium]|nr:ABC transporter permease [Bacteroidales bacterium]
MLRNYLKIAFRNLLRNKTFSLINIFGLAVGMALSIMMFLYVYNELTYDNFHKFKDRIYIVELKADNVNEGTSISAIATAGIGPSLLEEMPEVENMVRFSNPRSGFFSYNQKNYKAKNIIYSDSSVFDVFSFRLIKGNPKTALIEPFTIVLTEKTAKKLFGNNNPIGKIVKFNNQENLLITGIVENPPENSQIKFNVLISFATLYKMQNTFLGWDGGHSYYTYIKLNQNASLQRLYDRLPPFMEKHINYKYRQFGSVLSLIFEPLEKIHLYSDVSDDLPTAGNLDQIYILSGIAVFILLIACINFINLSTARSIKRAKEVSLRKVVGATKGKIITQFLGESFLLSFISLIIALMIIEIIRPVFNSLVYTNLNLYDQSNINILSGLVFITLITGLIAGSFPAFYISGFQPVAILKGGFNTINGFSFSPITSMLVIGFT